MSQAAVQAAAPPETPPAAKKIVHWADLIRVLAIYLVVVIHTSGQITNAWGKVSEADWLIGDVYGGIARVGVPLFFMLSGYLLLPRSESLRSFYSRRVLKIVIPFAAWSVIYISLNCIGKPGMCTRDYLLQYILLKKTYFHLWFLYSLLGIYLILPVLRLIVRPGTPRALLWYVIVLWLLFQPIRTLMDQFLHFSLNINSQLTTSFLPYFFLGYLLGEMELTRARTWMAAALFTLGALVTIIGTYLLTRASGHFNGYFYDYVTIGVIPATAGAFLLLRRLSDVGFLATERFHTFIRRVAGTTFGVYLVHILVLNGLDLLHVNALMGSGLWSVPLVATLVFALAFVLAWLLQRIPVINSIVPG